MCFYNSSTTDARLLFVCLWCSFTVFGPPASLQTQFAFQTTNFHWKQATEFQKLSNFIKINKHRKDESIFPCIYLLNTKYLNYNCMGTCVYPPIFNVLLPSHVLHYAPRFHGFRPGAGSSNWNTTTCVCDICSQPPAVVDIRRLIETDSQHQ